MLFRSGADIAFVVGLAVSAIAYCLLSCTRDLTAEQRAIEASERLFEGDES